MDKSITNKYIALGKNVFCKEIKEENKVGELYIPDSINTDFTLAEVVLASGSYIDNGSFISNEICAGDKILFPKVSGTKVTLDGEEYIRVHCTDVVCKKIGD